MVNNSFSSLNKVANIKIINGKNGNIIGFGKDSNANVLKNQVGFGFNNNDKSSNNTRNEIINKGNITIGGIESAGIQLKPENSRYKTNNGVTTTTDKKWIKYDGGN